MTNKIQWSFFFKQQLCRYCFMDAPHGPLTKCMEIKLDGNYTRMLRTVFKIYWKVHSHKTAAVSPPTTHHEKLSKFWQTRHAGHCWEKSWRTYKRYKLTPSHGRAKSRTTQLEPIYNSSVPIQDVALKTFRERWTIERGVERGSGRSVLADRHDDDILKYVKITQKYKVSCF